MDFTLAHGAANDFVVLADLDDRLDLPPTVVRALCDRRLGLGADGVLRLGAPPDGAHVFMDYRNADGGIVEMCGNGVRVVAKHVVDHGLVTPDGDTVVVATRAGNKRVTVERGEDGRVHAATVDMGPPIWDPSEIPYDATDPDATSETIDVDGAPVELTAVSMGNPHAVIVVGDVDAAPVRTLGPRLENDDRFPKRVNVGFAEVTGRDRIRLRVWERGVGETAACGTGACAAVAALQRRDAVDAAVDVHLPGGVLTVRYDPATGGGVLMTGPAVEVAHGTLDPAWLTAARTAAYDREVLR